MHGRGGKGGTETRGPCLLPSRESILCLLAQAGKRDRAMEGCARGLNPREIRSGVDSEQDALAGPGSGWLTQ